MTGVVTTFIVSAGMKITIGSTFELTPKDVRRLLDIGWREMLPVPDCLIKAQAEFRQCGEAIQPCSKRQIDEEGRREVKQNGRSGRYGGGNRR